MSAIKLFETQQVCSPMDQHKEVWLFSIVDVVAVLTDSPNPRTCRCILKNRLAQPSLKRIDKGLYTQGLTTTMANGFCVREFGLIAIENVLC